MHSPSPTIQEMGPMTFLHDPTVSLPRQSDMPLLPTPINTSRRRRPSKVGGGPIIKRSASTPNVRGLVSRDSTMSLAEKRRNKLGYHRTSVACVHCRRRKIRCLLAHDDIQNRCSNCIRLKKECNFFPVDQQPSLERRPQSDSKADFRSGEASTSSSSSPRMVGGHVMEQIDHFVSFPTLPLDSHSFSHSVAPLSASLISPPSTIGSQGAQGFDFPHPDRPNWEHQYVDHGPLSAGHAVPEDHNRSYWKHVDSPMTPYSPFSSKAPNSAVHQLRDTGEGFAQFGGTRPDHGWMPQRSISYGHLEDLPHQYHLGYHQPQHTNARRRASEMRPPSLQTSNNSSSASVSEASNPPASAPLSNPSIHHYGPPQAWHGLPGNSPLSKSTEFGSWYSEPGPLAKVQEEEVDPRFGGHPAILYSNTGHH